MNEVNPTLLLMASLLALGALIAWGLGIYVAVRRARTARQRAWRWALSALLAGPVFLGTAHLAGAYRRSAVGWVAAQAVSLAVVALAAVKFLPGLLGASLASDLMLLLVGLLIAFAPLWALAGLGTRRAETARPSPDTPMISAANLHKSYDLGGRSLRVLRGVSLSVRRGEFVAILGASGSGKSTLLHLLGLLDSPDGGSIVLDGSDSTSLRPPERDRIRSRDIGFVFQFYHLLPELNVLENTLLPAMTATGAWGWARARRQLRKRAAEILEQLGLGERLRHRPKELSGGEQQRVAIARALMNHPKILLADEPTGNLDSKTGAQILGILKQLNAEAEQTIVMVTHDQVLAAAAGRVLRLRDGRLH